MGVNDISVTEIELRAALDAVISEERPGRWMQTTLAKFARQPHKRSADEWRKRGRSKFRFG